MAAHNDLGKEGEKLAKSFLERKGYTILETGWRAGRAEIDIIARKQDILVFVEVKTRRNNTFGYPEDSVGDKKEQLLFEAAGFYMREIGYEDEIRFDIIAITMQPKQEIRHFRDAFFPGWS